jgi:DNA polymerase III epsilon subunit-like protein
MYLFVDTETTAKTNPKICQIAMVFTDNALRTKGIVSSYVRADGWGVPASATAYHGITTKDCETYGMPIQNLLKVFKFYAEHSSLVVAHNAAFDKAAIEREMEQHGIVPPDTKWFCTMRESSELVGIKHGNGGYKWPKLSEAFNHFTGKPLENAHDALADTRACREVFKGILKVRHSSLELV